MTAATASGALHLGRDRGLGRPFAAQLASTGSANLADGVLGTLAPLVALTLTTSPVQVSLLSAATWLPWLLFGLAAGVVVDRVDRRRVQVAALSVRAGVLALAAVLAATGGLTIGWLVALVLGYGVTEVFADLGATSIVPDLVPADRLSAANGRVIGVQQVTNTFLGAPLGGALLVLGAGLGFGAAAGLAALAAVVLAVGLQGDFRRASAAADAPRHPLAQLREGLAFLLGHRVLRPLVVASGVLNFASSAYFAVFVLWAVGPASAMQLPAPAFPLLMLGFAGGAVVGSAIAERCQRRFGEVDAMLTCLTASVVLLLVPLLVPHPLAVGAALALVGVTNTVGNVIAQSLRQRLVPGALLGRVGGAGRTLALGLMPAGALLGGLVAEHAGLAATFIGAVVVSLAACFFLRLSVRQASVFALTA